MNLRYTQYGIGAICVALGIFVFLYWTQFSPELNYDSLYQDPTIGLYYFEFPYDDDIFLYTVLGGSHVEYYMTRSAEFDDDNEKRIGETLTVQNWKDEELKLSIIERHSDSDDRAFDLTFKPRSDEINYIIQERSNMFIFQIFYLELFIGVGGIIVVYAIQRRITKIDDDSDLSDMDFSTEVPLLPDYDIDGKSIEESIEEQEIQDKLNKIGDDSDLPLEEKSN